MDLDADSAQKVAQELKAFGVQALGLRADVTVEDEVEAMAEEVERSLGPLSISVNNAGICINAPAEAMTLAQWRTVIDINLTGVFLTARAAGRRMIRNKTGGSIINIASMSGDIVVRPQPQCAYNATKAGVVMLSKSLAVE